MKKTKDSTSTKDDKRGAGTPAGSNTASPSFDCYAIVEIMGHNTFAGRVTEQSVGGAAFVRVDVAAVPETKYASAQPAFTKLFGAASIYSITPCSQEVAEKAARSFHSRPVTVVDIQAPRVLSAGDSQEDWVTG